MLPDARKAAGEYCIDIDKMNLYYADLIASIHPFARQRDMGAHSGTRKITDDALAAAMDGECRPFLPIPSMLADYNNRLNAKIIADIKSGNRTPIIMLSDMGDGDHLYTAGTMVLAAKTWAILATVSGMARVANDDEYEFMKSEAATQTDAPAAVVGIPESQNGCWAYRLRKAVTIHARLLAA